MRRTAALLASALVVAAPATRARAAAEPDGAVTIELRITPPFVRPYGPSLGGRLAVPVGPRWYLGAGYELVQDYDGILWTAKDTGHKPIALSAMHAGGWYRGAGHDPGWSWALGGLVAFANSTLSLSPAPDGIDRGTYVIDMAADVSAGRTRNGTRVEVFATPAWSLGRIASPAVGTSEGVNRFTYRFGIAFSVLVGS